MIRAAQFARRRTEDWVVSIDVTVTEVADQQHIAEGTESCGGECDAPGSIECPGGCDATNQVAVGVVDIHIAQAGAVQFILPVRILQRIRDIDIAANGLDAEWRKPAGKLVILESSRGQSYRGKLVVEYVDRTIVEIRG